MNVYEEKQAARAERFHALAIKAADESKVAYDYSNRLTSVIPFGQPILVGHHSEGMHRRHIERIHNQMDKSIELADKAEYYERRAEAAENNNSISSDDPDAVTKLKDKLQKLESLRIVIKARPHESWELSNLSGNIATVKKRIEYLESHSKDSTTSKEYGEIKVIDNVDDNRIQVFFPGIPNQDIRDSLKRNGFRWTPSVGCWGAFRGAYRLQLANEIAIKANGVP